MADHPEFLSLENLQGILDYAGKAVMIETLNSLATWLADKGYVEIKEIKGERSRIRVKTLRVTARGFDLYDQNNDLRDEGVIF